MNIILFSLITFVVIYIAWSALKYATSLVLSMTLVITGSTLANHYGGQSAMLLILFVTPVLYVVVTDLVGTLKSAKLPFALATLQANEKQHQQATDLVEAAPLTGEWISGQTPELTFQQPLIGDVKALPKPWL